MVLYVANESMALALRSLVDLQLYDSGFQTKGALTLNVFPDNASAIRVTVCPMITICREHIDATVVVIVTCTFVLKHLSGGLVDQ